MFGRCAKNHEYLPPATTKEQRKWIRHKEDHSDSDSESVISTSESHMDLEDESIPSFPYPNGPGHSAASSQAIKIIWRTMSKSGVEFFIPDFKKSMTAYINQFLWDIAIRSFMQLVRCGEYPPLTPNLYTQDEIQEAFADHAEYLARM
jgi:hypothetical protein